MRESIEVIYENGVLRPLDPLPDGVHEQQRLIVVVETADVANDWLAAADPSVSLEDVRRVLSKVPDTVSQMVWEEREER
jgi:predicted DNA-binding antitoxin AbrB/MazE fold protein